MNFTLIKVAFVVFIEFIILTYCNFKGRRLMKSDKLDEAIEVFHAGMLRFGQKVIESTGSEVEIRGEQYLTDETFLIVVNHQSLFDIPLTAGYLKIFTGYIGRENLAKIPFVKPWISLEICGMLNRDDPREAIKTINHCAGTLKKGISQLIYPEGTRTPDGEVKEFKAGAFKLATKAKVKILPISIDGCRNLLPKGSLKLTPSKLLMEIHEPIDITGKNTKELAEEAHSIISKSVYAHQKLLASNKGD